MVTTNAVSDAELIASATAGDVDAFGSLVSRYQAQAIRVAAMALGSADGADDVAQDAFVKAHRSLARFRIDKPFAPWLFRIVTNTARNRQRTEGRQQALAFRAANQGSVGGPGPEEIATHNSERTVLLDAINRLRADDRVILLYRWYEEMTEAEIAQALGCRQGTVKSRLNRAMDRLRAEMPYMKEDAQ